MRKVLILSTVLSMALSCNTEKANIKGFVEGLDKDTLVLKILAINNQYIKDTIITEEGKINYNLKLGEATPDFYYLYFRDRKIASFVVLPGDYIKFSTDTLGNKYLIEGSKESALLKEAERETEVVKWRYDSLMMVYGPASERGDTALMRSINYQLGSLYVKHKQKAIKKIYSDPMSITNIVLLYEKFPNGLPMFADPRDVLLFRRVQDSLEVTYPGSAYIGKLADDITRMDNTNLLNSKIKEANESGHPEITLPDINASQVSLSQLKGNVILLSFWNSSDVDQRLYNQEYLTLYNKYREKGFEIYQVAVDVDKTSWANTVRAQNLPWISVCDGYGANSPAVKSYNVTEIPVNFLIDKRGVITGRNLYDADLERELAKLFR
jgi:peroxiredoxin